MLKVLHYALATFCFAASVGCLALWGWVETHSRWDVAASYYTTQHGLHFESIDGVAILWVGKGVGQDGWKIDSMELRSVPLLAVENALQQHRLFGRTDQWVYFPLWYPALIFTLAGIAALRLGRRFTLRSAIIATTVVTGLLGMAVAM